MLRTGGEASRLTVRLCVVVPPALPAVHVNGTMPSLLITVVAQPVASPTGDSASASAKLTVTSPWKKPLACVAPEETFGVTDGGVLSSDWVTALSARTNPEPQSKSGAPTADVQSFAFATLRRIAYTSFTVMEGLTERMSTAMPAALGAAALVPKKGSKSATLVDTPSAAARSGLARTSGLARGGPVGLNRRAGGPPGREGLGGVEPAALKRT